MGLFAKIIKALTGRPRRGRSHRPSLRNAGSPSVFQQGVNDGEKGRANRYATTADFADPYWNAKKIAKQLAYPGTPEEYKRGYRVGLAKARRRHAKEG